MTIVGKVYLLAGEPVLVEQQWKGVATRNVRILHPDGRRDIRPFRGLRKPNSVITRLIDPTTCEVTVVTVTGEVIVRTFTNLKPKEPTSRTQGTNPSITLIDEVANFNQKDRCPEP
jgi:hypothetical protein